MLTDAISPTTPILLVVNGFLLALSLSFLLIILWYDLRRTIYQFFALFLLLVVFWNVGFLLSQLNSLIGDTDFLGNFAIGVANIGFAGAGAGLYALVTVLIGVQTRYFRFLALISIGLVVVFNSIVLVNNVTAFVETPLNTASFRSFSGLFYVLFDTIALYLAWRYRRKIQNTPLLVGIIVFVLGRGIGFVNSELGIASVSLLVASFGVLLISIAFIRQELINPLVNRNQQLESMHKVSLAITSGITSNRLLTDISERAVLWLEGDASCIYVPNQGMLEIVALHNLPLVLLQSRSSSANSLANQVAITKQSILIENYRTEDLVDPLLSTISDTFGSVIGTPLIYDEQVIGVLVVIASRQNRLFSAEDVHLLELLASQAAVAIAHDRLFNNRMVLTNQLQVANDQLQTVLTSTESPVIALDRRYHLIFSNRVATQLLQNAPNYTLKSLVDVLPTAVLPKSFFKVVRDIRKFGVHVYEIGLADKTYLCHLGSWGKPKIEGWVAVLHDVSELKELDRIKSEMVRMTSHDLKNPLQAAMANLDLLRDDIEESFATESEVVLSLNNVEKQLVKMQRIIGGILDLERVRMGVHLNELCQPAQIMETAIDEMRDIAEDRHIELIEKIAPNLPEFLGDRAQFERAVINLIDNAVKFTPTGGTVTIEAEQQAVEVVFSVKDTGVGIPMELHDKIFERFFRGQQAGIEHISGTGLGLSLVKSVVESHHGRIWVESEVNKGTTFYIAVPFYKETLLHTKEVIE